MRFALICLDKPDALQTRVENRSAHLAHIEATGVVEQAGPFLDQDGQMCAEAWAAMDPYAKAGLFASVSVQEWKRVVG
jgi:uncharacterized protein